MKVLPLLGKSPIPFPYQKYLINWDREVSKPQKKVKSFLRKFWGARVVLEEARIPKSLFRLDLFNITDGIIVEISPNAVHCDFNPFFHKNRASGFLKKLKADTAKRDWALKNNFQYVELFDEDLKNLSRELFLEKFQISL